jgi:hypothetical protein
MPINDVEGVLATCFGSSDGFLPSRPGFDGFHILAVGDFRPDCKDSPSSAPFHFFQSHFLPLILLHLPLSLPFYDTDGSLPFYSSSFFFRKLLIVWIIKSQRIHDSNQPSFFLVTKSNSHQLVLLLRIITQYFVTHRLNCLQPLSARTVESILELEPIR